MLVDFDDYEHPAGDCLREPYAHFTEPKWCGHPLCLYDWHDGDLGSIETSLSERGFDLHQVERMMESYYLPLKEQDEPNG
jgi:hypothetical protein